MMLVMVSPYWGGREIELMIERLKALTYSLGATLWISLRSTDAENVDGSTVSTEEASGESRMLEFKL
jgi:hypothetical protein